MHAPSIPVTDQLALAAFLAMWLGYSLAQRHLGPSAINNRLHAVRVLWMRAMLLRDNRISDSSLIGHVIHSASFFASTSLIAIGALLGVLTGLDRLQPAINELSFGPPPSRARATAAATAARTAKTSLPSI